MIKPAPIAATALLLALSALGGCGPSTVVVDGSGDGADPGGDTGKTADTSSTGDSTDTSGNTDSADTADTADTDPPGDPADCVEYGVIAVSSATLAYGASLDSYDASIGVYGGENMGSDATVAVNGAGDCALTSGATVAGDLYVSLDPAAGYCEEWGAAVSGGVHQLPGPAEVPTVAVPTGMPATQGSVYLNWGETRSFAGDETFDSLRFAYGSTVTVTAPSRIVTEEFSNEGAPLSIAPGASLEVYVTGDTTVVWGSEMNSEGSPSQLRIYVVGNGTVSLANGATMNAVVFAPDGAYTSAGTLSGALVADTLNLEWGAVIHEDVSARCP